MNGQLAPKGLEGVVVADTTLGDVRGREGFYHYRQYSATDLAASRSFEDVWALMIDGVLPDQAGGEGFRREVSQLRHLPASLAEMLPRVSRLGTPLDVLRTAVSLLGAAEGWRPLYDSDASELRRQALRLAAVTPTILAATHRLRSDWPPVRSRAELGFAANYLWMLTGREPTPEEQRAVEQYLILTVDHGFNASTFTARVIASTEADLAAAITGAVGALSGPLHGGAPSRALEMLDAIGRTDQAEQWISRAVEHGERIMGFGHRVYKTDDPRSIFLRQVARDLGGESVAFALEVEQVAIDVLSRLKPGRQLYTNVEFYAGVVMDRCGIRREMFTPTFAAGRMVGWSAHVLEQAQNNRLIRPSARYVGPPPHQPIPVG